MVQAQIIGKILASNDYSILVNNNLTNEYFPEYREEIEYIRSHIDTYGNVPDIPTFIEKFPDFTLVEVTESDRYLVDTVREEWLYAKSVPVLQRMAELLKTDANAAAQYMLTEIPNLQPNYTIPAVDILHDKSRLSEFKERSEDKGSWCIPTGFEELDDIINGWETKEELAVVFARTNQGKSWVVLKACEHASHIGKTVAYISPEMSPNRLAYRFDTMEQHFSNSALMRGDVNTVSLDEYEAYLTQLAEQDNSFWVATPKDFNNEITVGKLRNFVTANHIDLLAVDGITYLTDERYRRGDNKTTTLTNISEDLMQLSIDCNIPVIIVVQSNRGGVKEESNATPELEDIRDSDGISHNATKVISIRQKEGSLMLAIKKNRYGRVGDKVTYHWDIDTGTFEYMANADDTVPVEKKEERKRQIAEEYIPNNRKIMF